MSHPTWIRTVYLYLFALVGLVISVIGTVMLVNLGLKAWIFTKADQDVRYYESPPSLVFSRDVALVEDLKACGESCELSDEQLRQIDLWLSDYAKWQERQENQETVDYTQRSRHQQASTAVSMIIVGVPLYLYHWFIIKRDRRRRKEEN